MNTKIFLLLLLSISFLYSSNETPRGIPSPPPQVELLRTGFFYKDTLFHQSGEQWFGLFKTVDGYELKETVIQVEPVQDSCSGDNENEKNGREVTVDNPQDPLILIRGLSSLVEGSIKTVYSDNVFFYPAQFMSWNLGNEDRRNYFSIHVFGCFSQMPDRPNDLNTPLKDYSIQLSNLTHSQQLCFYERVDMDSPPITLWAGDLDRDNKLDLLMDLSPGGFAQKLTLFLSSFAEGDELVSKVAEILIESC